METPLSFSSSKTKALILAVIEDALVEAGFTVNKASSGEEAIEMLDASAA